MDKNRRTFLQNAAAASLFALSGSKVQSAPLTPGRVPIHFDLAADLDKDDVYKFLHGTSMTWDAPLTVDQQYSQSSVPKKSVGVIDKYPDDMKSPDGTPSPLRGTPLRLFWAVQRRCRVFEGPGKGQLVGLLNLVIPQSWQVTVQAYAVLFTKNDGSVPADVKSRMETAFNNFQYPKDGDPLDYLQKIMSGDSTIKTDYFSVENTFSLNKVAGSFHAQHDTDLAIQDLYAGKANGTIYTGPNSPEPLDAQNGFFARRNLKLVCAEGPPEFLGRIPQRQPNPHEVVLQSGQTPQQAVQLIAASDQPQGCGDLTENDWPIMTLVAWPEFRLVSRDFTFEIGCGIRIILTLPVLQFQTRGTDLWVYTKYPNKWAPVVSIIRNCAFESALAGGVVGVVLLDPVAGLAVFDHVFEQCITDHLMDTIECMVPGLGLVTSVKKDWQDVKI